MEWRVADDKLEVSMGLLWSPVEVYDGEQNQLRVELVPGRGEVVGFLIREDQVESITYRGRKFMRFDR